jgi:hypothetical protein
MPYAAERRKKSFPRRLDARCGDIHPFSKASLS